MTHLNHFEVETPGLTADGARRDLSLCPVAPVLGARVEALEAALAALGPRELRAPALVLRYLGVRPRLRGSRPACGPAAPCGCPGTRTFGPVRRRMDH